MHAERQIRFAGQTWMLHTVATPQYMKTHRGWGVWLTLLFGLLIIGILGAFLLMTSGRARRPHDAQNEQAQRARALVHDPSLASRWRSDPAHRSACNACNRCVAAM